ncbi:energy-coupling factor transporter ATPase [Mycoplasmopsis cricetuli]|uniref:energy-coupling factor transporter ATPase n=1 Tax=Mycoplasmopsis cricetuli TaxID=171283 RepID=UPI000471A5E8|nr:energy-coupling factor transporter ATPase [Mycoplasmopsis cricetuli]
MQIKLKNVEHIFSPKTPWEFKALNGIDIEIQQGEYIGVIGQTGSGKTTFIQHLNGLLFPSEGFIQWHYIDDIYNKKNKIVEKTEKNIIIPKIKNSIFGEKKSFKFKNSKSIKRHIGVVFQFAEYQLFKQTVLDDIIFAPIAFGVPIEEAKERAKHYLQMVGLSLDYLNRSPFDLSGGQKRRVALAGILAMKPDFLVVDEPTAGLDPVGVVEILNILSSLNEQGITIVNVTHELDHVLERAKRVVVFKKGKIVKDGDPYKILNDISFLQKNDLQPPKLLNFVDKLRKKGLNVPEVRSIEELSQWLNKKGGN